MRIRVGMGGMQRVGQPNVVDMMTSIDSILPVCRTGLRSWQEERQSRSVKKPHLIHTFRATRLSIMRSRSRSSNDIRIWTGYARSLWCATLSVDYLESRSLFRKIFQPFGVFRSISPQFNAEPSSVDPGDNSLGNTERRLQIRQFKE
jgi:hypothetical protein